MKLDKTELDDKFHITYVKNDVKKNLYNKMRIKNIILLLNFLIFEIGAGNEVRTRDLNLGKVALYQLSYSRIRSVLNGARGET